MSSENICDSRRITTRTEKARKFVRFFGQFAHKRTILYRKRTIGNRVSLVRQLYYNALAVGIFLVGD